MILIEFRRVTLKLLETNRPTKIIEKKEDEYEVNEENDEESEEEDKFEEEELEERIYGLSELEDTDNIMEDDEYYRNPNSNNLGAGEAWWDLNNDDDYKKEVDYSWVDNEGYRSDEG